MAEDSTCKGLKPISKKSGAKAPEFKQVELEPSVSEPIFRMFAESSFAGFYVIQDGKFMSINKSAATRIGYQAKELIGKRAEAVIYYDHMESRKESFGKCHSGEL